MTPRPKPDLASIHDFVSLMRWRNSQALDDADVAAWHKLQEVRQPRDIRLGLRVHEDCTRQELWRFHAEGRLTLLEVQAELQRRDRLSAPYTLDGNGRRKVPL